jgi:transcriptional regulator with XRE-family HTH domain
MAASDPHSLGARIRRARKLRRLSQQQLADGTGFSVRAVGDWERGKSTPSNLPIVEQFLGVSFDSREAPFVPADDDEARIWAMDEPEEWRLKLIAWKRQGQSRAAS